jgi:hypothetical protein
MYKGFFINFPRVGVNMMTNIAQKVVYKCFGFNVLSDFPLPELPPLNEQKYEADIQIKKGDLWNKWNELAGSKEKFVVKRNLFMFMVSKTAIFCVENGREITISPFKGANEDKLRLFILGSCMGALLLQRKILPLHGSAIAKNGKAYALIGDSGAGKSTLASLLMGKGYSILSDDVIAISLSGKNVPFVIPSYPQQKLWQESLDVLGMEIDQYKPLFEREAKFAVPVTSQYLDESLPLAGIFEIVKTQSGKIELIQQYGIEKLHTLFNHTYRNILIPRMDLIEWHFDISAKLGNNTNIFQLRRPFSELTVQQLSSLVLNTIDLEEY